MCEQAQAGLSCSVVAPSVSAWVRALVTQIGLMGCVGAPIGALLHAAPRRTRRAVGLLAGAGVGAAVPIGISLGRQSYPQHVTWMLAFLASTLGFATFFKCLSVALSAHPEGADSDLSTWLLWFTSLPDARADGALYSYAD